MASDAGGEELLIRGRPWLRVLPPLAFGWLVCGTVAVSAGRSDPAIAAVAVAMGLAITIAIAGPGRLASLHYGRLTREGCTSGCPTIAPATTRRPSATS